MTHVQARSGSSRSAFTLVEAMVTMSVVSVLAGLVMSTLRPIQNLTAAEDAKRLEEATTLERALEKYFVETPSTGLYEVLPIGLENAKPICRQGVAGSSSCVSLEVLTELDYAAALPIDSAETSPEATGYTVYKDDRGFVYVHPIYAGATGGSGAEGVFCSADFNHDETVDSDDLSIMNANMGLSNATQELGDASGDGFVNGSDFLVWQQQVGADCGSWTSDPTPPALAQVAQLIDGQNGITELGRNYELDIVGDYAYVVNLTDDSLTVLDISDPLNPTQIGSVEDGVGATHLRTPHAVKVVGNYAYLSVYNENALTIIDVSDPENMVQVGSYVDAVNMGLPVGLDVQGSYAYVAAVGSDTLAIIDISNPASPTLAGFIKDGVGAQNIDGISSVDVRGSYAYVTAGNINDNAFSIINVSNPASPTLVSVMRDGIEAPQLSRASDVMVQGNYAYVASNGDDSLTIIDISNPAAPNDLGFIKDGQGATRMDGANKVHVVGSYAYVTSQYTDNGLTVIDISDPAAPVEVDNVANGDGVTNFDTPHGSFVRGNYLFVVADISSSFTVFSLR